MVSKRHTFKYTPQMLKQIDYVLPRLKYSVYIQQIVSWLENFDETDAWLALDYLFYLEYIPFSELQARLNQQLAALDKHFGGTPNYLVFPIGVYPKSSDVIMYLLAKCPKFRELEREARIRISRDHKNVTVRSDTVLVFADDFIGSGKSFEKWYKREEIASLPGSTTLIREEQAILAAIIMEGGEFFLTRRFPDITVFAEFRHRIFSKANSPFNLSGNRSELLRLCLKYGTQIQTGFIPPNKKVFHPFGFDRSEALVAFDYGTPNNSLSIIWGDKKWMPIFPREARSRMNKSSQIKTQAAFYLGLMHRLKVTFELDIRLRVHERDIRLSARDDHSILVYLILVDRRFSPIQICQVLGITTYELRKIISKARSKKLANSEGHLTRLGIEFLGWLKSKANIFTFRENDELKVRDEKIFVPKSFGNTS